VNRTVAWVVADTTHSKTRARALAKSNTTVNEQGRNIRERTVNGRHSPVRGARPAGGATPSSEIFATGRCKNGAGGRAEAACNPDTATQVSGFSSFTRLDGTHGLAGDVSLAYDTEGFQVEAAANGSKVDWQDGSEQPSDMNIEVALDLGTKCEI
jgi:hypothetical protein